MNRKQLVLGIVAVTLGALALVGCDCGGTPPPAATGPLAGRVTLSGAWALYPMAQKWAEEFRKLNPNVTIDINGGGAGKGMTDVLAGAVSLGMVSRAVKPEEVAQGAFPVAVTKDAVVPTINAANPALAALRRTGVTRDQLAGIYLTGTVTTWNQLDPTLAGTKSITVFTRSDACGAAQVWAEFLGNKKQEDLKGTGVANDPGVAEAVRQDPLAIGFNNINFAYDPATLKPFAGLAILPLDANGNGTLEPAEDCYADRNAIVAAINDGRYPSPPARDLYLVARGKPADPAVVAFLTWVLTDGQRYVAEAGYVGLAPATLAAELAKLQ